MVSMQIAAAQAGQRLDKYLKRELNKATSSFIYKMLRKKNITLNGAKATGSEMLCENDEVKLFFSDETYAKFKSGEAADCDLTDENTYAKSYARAYDLLSKISIVFENEHILVLNKPAGILSQKSAPEDLSTNEWLIGYLLESGFTTEDELSRFKPSVCNRLDRNTSGLLVCGKTLLGSRYLSRIIKDKSLEKYYYALVLGNVKLNARVNGWLCKDERANKASILSAKPDDEAWYVDTAFKTVKSSNGYTLLEAQLFTGKTHQIRAQLGAMGHPIVGDRKYGYDSTKGAPIRNHLLHAHRLVFPKTQEGAFADTSGMALECVPPEIYERLLGVKI